MKRTNPAPRCNLKKKQNQFQHFSHTDIIVSPSTFKRHRIDSHFTFKSQKIDSPPTFKSHKIDSLLPLKVTKSIRHYLEKSKIDYVPIYKDKKIDYAPFGKFEN